jgi:hypothetical protein
MVRASDTVALQRLPLTGRDTELGQIRDALASTRAGAGG